MKKSIKLTLIGSFAALSLFAGESGAELFKEKCAVCHMQTKPTPEQKKNMVAPPVMGVMFHIKEKYGDDKKKAIEFIKDYVMNPSEDKALCLPRSIKRFGLMPSQKGSVTQEELEKIAEYMYDNFPPKGFKHPKMK